MVRLMGMIPMSKVLAENTRVNEAAPIREGLSGRRRGMFLVLTGTLRSDEVRVNSEAPRAAVTQMFVCIGKAAANTK